MAIRKGLPAKLALTDADDTRYLFSGLVVCNVDGSPRGGVLSPVGTSLVTATATMNVSVARFQGVAVRDGGVVYAKQNDSSATVAVPDANNTPVLGFVKGTAGAIPVKPSLPAGALELATVEIPSGATATNSGGVVITQTAPFTAGAGGTVPFRTKTAMDLWTTAQSSQSAIVLADRSVWYSSAGVWSSLDDAGAWIYPTLTNGTNQAGNSFGYRRLVNSGVKVVYLRGRVTGVSSGQTMVTLPVGYRPDAGDDNVLILDQNTQRVNVKSDGTIVALSTWGINSASFLGVNFIAV